MLTEHQVRGYLPLRQNSSFQGALSSRPNPAHRPKVGGRLLSFPAQVSTPGGSALIMGTHNWFQVSRVFPVVMWKRSPSAIPLKGLAPFHLCPCDCDSVAHPRPFCSVFFKDLCSGWALVGSAGCWLMCSLPKLAAAQGWDIAAPATNRLTAEYLTQVLYFRSLYPSL